MASRLICRNVIALRGRTSIRLEPEFWSALAEIAMAEECRISELVRRAETVHAGGRTSAVAVFVLDWFRARVANKEKHP